MVVGSLLAGTVSTGHKDLPDLADDRQVRRAGMWTDQVADLPSGHEAGQALGVSVPALA